MKNNNLTPKQERFALNLFSGMSQREAYIQAGYGKGSSLTTIDNHAYELAHNGEIMARLNELHAEVKSEKIADKAECEEILTEIARAKLSQFTTGGVIDQAKLDSSAIQAIDEQTTLGGRATVVKLRLHNPISAISELNKMERIYEVMPPMQDNRQYNFYIEGSEAKEKLKRLIAGEKPIIEGEVVNTTD